MTTVSSVAIQRGYVIVVSAAVTLLLAVCSIGSLLSQPRQARLRDRSGQDIIVFATDRDKGRQLC